MDKEADRQRVLIQITQNLATRIRNSHAFNLPTFYLPREDGPGCSIPNAIEDVCKEIDKVIYGEKGLPLTITIITIRLSVSGRGATGEGTRRIRGCSRLPAAPSALLLLLLHTSACCACAFAAS